MSCKPNEPIAIVGSACHFAGDANSPSKLWELLREPRDVRKVIPDSRFSAKGFYHPNGAYHGHSNVMHSYLVNKDLSTFDAEFFGVKPVEAKAMDPQQRLLMETVYEAIEAAGLTIEGLRGSDTGVYVGAMGNDYEAMLLRDLQTTPTYYATGTGRSILSNRVSYFFDWRGASLTIDTACSSSLVALHMAVQALRAGESRMALACGANLILGPESYIIESKLKMLSPDGLGRMWDRDANGYARGDGVAAVVLKTLSAAIADGDHVESIIRETGLNQDGATPGITMPSASAQQALIHSTYTKYFEAHGTGTPAGDPIEAEAIRNAFFKHENEISTTNLGGDPLYVGSLKTVLGHTEGTAGVAALLKASLALQHALIPPNLLFNNLSDRVAPFYKNIEILRTAKPWPEVPESQPRRASVNSFGFGGANAHAILESYENLTSTPDASGQVNLFTPFVFSAASEQSLRANLSAYAAFLADSPAIDIRNLAWTLRQRRGLFAYRIPFTAGSIEDLRSKITTKLEEENTSIGVKALSTSKRGACKILGIFTGQGAQYARMGAELIEKSLKARRIVQELESCLAQLPGKDRPNWSLQAEILADASSSRVNEAAISQPLCTAVQILLVDLLRSANVNLDAVVGHSSGEIGAAYASGYLTARDAMYIAYYRGLHVQLARSPNGENIEGAMLAVGTSMEDAAELCGDEAFSGRISVAASNSSSSVTISGDEDAIAELQVILDDEKKFNRRLRVDKAYHSSHMLQCFDPYVESVRRCGVKARKPSSSQRCTWFSSVTDRRVDSEVGLSDTYWAENMTRPVLFSQALSSALSTATFDVVLEIGPHPALRGPACQTVQDLLEKDIPYQGMLTRGIDAVEAASASFGFLWSYLDSTSINLNGYDEAMTGDGQRFNVIKGLPTYQWNHDVKHWHESRISRRMRLRKQSVHSLLGDISPDSSPHHLSWRNLLRVNEMDWLSGHQVQSQTVFPAAGYVSTALEASKHLADGKEIRLIEISNFVIHQAIAFDQDDMGIEVLISMAEVTRAPPDRIRARFTYSAALGAQPEDLSLAASGEVEISLGDPSTALLPKRAPTTPHMIDLEPERFYSALKGLGCNFTGRFCALSSMSRKQGKSSCLVRMAAHEAGDESLLIHPGELDAAFQSLTLAYSYPNDDRILSLHLPTDISHIRVNPALCGSTNRSNVEFFPVDSALARGHRDASGSGFTGDVSLYSNDCLNAAIQVQGLKLVPLMAIQHDRKVFSKMHWVGSSPDGLAAASDTVVTQRHRDTVSVLERISTFYLREFDRIVPQNHPLRHERPTSCYLDYARHMSSLVKSGKNRWAKKEWLNDTLDNVMEACKGFEDVSNVRIMHLVGQQMPRVFEGETTMLEQFRLSNLLDPYYANGFGLYEASMWISRAVSQIADRYPHMNILEIGAGTGGATKKIFRAIGHNFLTYTFTDVSSGFFENATSVFSQQKDRMVFKVFDAERDPLDQGFTEGGYDLVVASFVIHATAKLKRTMGNIRKLLRPGGFLVVGEGSHDGLTGGPGGFIFGPLPGWWLGVDEGRTLSPFVSDNEWDRLLKTTGFSGIDTMAPKEFGDTLGVSLFVSQAVDDQVTFLRQPLAAPSLGAPIEKLVIIGGQTAHSTRLVKEVKAILKKYAAETFIFKTLRDVDYSIVDSKSTVISLTELDKPVFKDMTPTDFFNFKPMFEVGKTLLWITSGRLADEPFSNMTVGFGRVAVHETTDLRLQCLDIPDPSKIDPRVVAEALLRLQATVREDNILWTAESEVIINAEGRQLVPRLRPISALNDRYNSARRSITHELDISKSAIILQQDQNACTIKELPEYDTSDQSEPFIEMRTTHAVLSALKTPIGHKFLTLGVEPSTGAHYLALVPSLLSTIKVPAKSTIRCQMRGFSKPALLTLVAAYLVSMTVVDPLVNGQTLVVHNPTTVIAQAIAAKASMKDVEVVYTTDTTDSETPSSWIGLSRYLSQIELSEILPSEVSCFVGLSNQDVQRSENELTILSSLSPHCRKETAKTIYSYDGYNGSSSSIKILGQILQRALEYAQQHADQEQHSLIIESVCLENLVSGVRPNDPMAVIDWTVSPGTLLPVHVTRLDSRPLFKGDKTYWVVGLTGALGISLCDWMIDRGAKILVLTSRSPKIAPEWVASHKHNGADITVMPCDVTNGTELKSVYETICATLPPIIGVLNGAMVLRDTSILNMSWDQLNNVIRPKVYGSINLDQIFRDQKLDFFILFSSINCMIGNLGQANYAAANTFMCALAGQRRKRGLAATTLNVGAIIGAGYMERESSKILDLTVQKMAMMHLSEEDLHQIFAEGIKAGHPDSPDGPEFSTGLLDIIAGSPDAPRWNSDPKFLPFIIHQKEGDKDKNEQTATTSIQDLLQACQTHSDLIKVIRQTFAAQLRSMLQMIMADDDLMSMRSDEIGLDSLISVDIRSWFLKNFQVSIPVLKVMGKDTMANLAQLAAESIPAELVPQIDTSGNTPSYNGEANIATGQNSPGEYSSETSPADSSVDTPATQASSAPTPPESVKRETSDNSIVNWDAEARIPPDFGKISLGTASPTPASPPNIILLTGVSGLLGHHLLNYLLERTSAKRVICIAVRNLAERLQTSQLPRSDRVLYYEGDLRQPQLGLSEQDAATIFAEVDAVIHNGADTSHLKYYRDIWTANVKSTIDLVRLCLPRKIPLHYVSSIGVGLFSAVDAFPEISATSALPPADGSHGYISSKWTNELLLERVNKMYGLRVWIHRPSTIIREGEDAKGTKAQMDWVNALLHYVHQMKAVPKVEHIRGALDLVYVQNVCADIVGHMLNNKPRLAHGLSYVHQVGDIVIPLDHMQDVGKESGSVYKVLSMSEWTAKAIAAGLHPAVAALIEEMDTPGGPNYPRLLKA
ncbi:putative polyketide synthase [Glonium stellatum]|uniref:Putative polyketide synthase n=1 Tax=Glonium stellatum TaxID=574774 RepID=A0A8E2FAH3_9PEZI|nr:putative polyketide synthase [Glonium stellatum]